MIAIGHSAFHDCCELERIELPIGIKAISPSVFYDCTSLMSAKISNSVTTIGEAAFYNCGVLTGITIPESVTTIGDEAFLGCSSLRDIIIPSEISSIGYHAFEKTAWLEAQPDGIIYIGNLLYGIKGKCPSQIKTRPGAVGWDNLHFDYCPSLKSIEILNGVIHIADRAFLRCTSLESIIIPNSVTAIGIDAFKECSSLTIKCNRGSYAEQYATKNRIGIAYLD